MIKKKMEEQFLTVAHYPNTSFKLNELSGIQVRRKVGISMLEKLISLKVLTILLYLLFFQILLINSN